MSDRVLPWREQKSQYLMGCCVAALAAIGFNGAAHAQDGASESADGAVFGDSIVVTARKRVENLEDIPLSVTVLGEDQVKTSNISDAQDVAPFVPNFELVEQQSPGVAFIFVRGIGQARFGEPPISVIVDGVQISNSYQITQQLTDIESLEVIKGPQGALYGRNAIGGALVINTKDPTDEFEGDFMVGYGTANDFRAEAGLRGPLIEDVLGFKIGLDYQDFDGDIINEGTGNGANFIEQFNLRSALLFQPTDNLEMDFRYSRLRVDAGGAFYQFPAPDPNVVGPWNSRFDNDAFRDIDDLSLKMDLELGDVLVTSVTAYSEVRSELAQDLLEIAGSPLDAVQAIGTDAFSQEIRFSSTNNDGFIWMLGGYFVDIDFASDTTLWLQLDPGVEPFASGLDLGTSLRREDRKSYSVFGQAQYRFDFGVELSAAFRYEYDDQESTTVFPGTTTELSSDALQPRFSVAYFFENDSQIYASAARGFRAAGFNGTPITTPTYEAETVWTYEAGYKGIFLNRQLSVNLAAFYNDIKNRQFYQLIFVPAFDQVIANPIDSSEAYGLEADALFQTPDGLTLQGSIGLLKTNINEWDPTLFGGDFAGNELPLSPAVSYSFIGQYEFDLGNGLTLTPRAEVNGKSKFWWEADNNPAQENDALTLANFRVTAAYNGFSVTGFLENAFDKEYNVEYIVGGFGAPQSIAAAAPGRRWGVRLRYSF